MSWIIYNERKKRVFNWEKEIDPFKYSSQANKYIENYLGNSPVFEIRRYRRTLKDFL